MRISETHWKIEKKIVSFLDDCIWIGSGTFSLLPEKYLSSDVNVLPNGLKISDITKKDFLQLKFCQSDQQGW